MTDRRQALDEDIRRMNISWLWTLRDIATESVEEAAMRFGVSAALARRVRDSTNDQLMQLVTSELVIFQPRMNSRDMADLIKGQETVWQKFILDCASSIDMSDDSCTDRDNSDERR